MTQATNRRVALWAIALLACALIIARTPFTTDMSAFLPRAPTPAQQALVDQLREGVVSRLILAGIEGARPATLAVLSKQIAQQLRVQPGIGSVGNGDATGLDNDRELLWRNRYLLSPATTAEHFTPDALHAALKSGLDLLASDFGAVIKRTLPADPTGEMLRLIEALAGQAHPKSSGGVWVAPDETRALLMVQTLAPGVDLDAQQHAIAGIQSIFDAAKSNEPEAANARLVMSGPPVFAVRTRARMQADTQRFSAIAIALVTAILLLAYRSVRVLLLALFPVVSGALAGIAAVALGFGFVHGITLGFGVTLIGEAVDYAIYLFTQTAPGTRPASTLPRIWPTLRRGMLTSVCGFSAMLLSSFTGFAQLGLFTIVGLLAALTVTRFILPTLLPQDFAGRSSDAFAIPLLALMRTIRAPRRSLIALTTIAVASLFFHAGPYWEDELASMSPLTTAEKALDGQLRNQIGAPDVRNLIIVTRSDRDAALEASEQLAARLTPLIAAGVLTGFDAPTNLLPSLATQRARQAALPDALTLQANLAEALAGTPFRAETFAPFLTDIETARRQPLLTRDALDRTSMALHLDGLLLRGRDGWLAMLPLHGVANLQRLATEIAGINDPNLVLLDLKTESDRLLGSYLREALILSLAGSAIIVLFLAISLRAPRRIATVLAPLAAAVICTAAILLAVSQRLSIFNLFGLLLVVAVGSNYSLFFEREPVAGAPGRRMIASLMLANLCTVIGFGVLAFSGIPVLRGIGSTVAVGAFLSLLFAAILSTSLNEPGY